MIFADNKRILASYCNINTISLSNYERIIRLNWPNNGRRLLTIVIFSFSAIPIAKYEYIIVYV